MDNNRYVWREISALVGSLGRVWIVLALIAGAGLIAALRHNEAVRKKASDIAIPLAACAIRCVASLVSILRAQDLSQQHSYIVMVPLLALRFVLIAVALDTLPGRMVRSCAIGGLLALSATSLTVGFLGVPEASFLPGCLVSIRYESDYDQKQHSSPSYPRWRGMAAPPTLPRRQGRSIRHLLVRRRIDGISV